MAFPIYTKVNNLTLLALPMPVWNRAIILVWLFCDFIEYFCYQINRRLKFVLAILGKQVSPIIANIHDAQLSLFTPLPTCYLTTNFPQVLAPA